MFFGNSFISNKKYLNSNCSLFTIDRKIVVHTDTNQPRNKYGEFIKNKGMFFEMFYSR